MPTSCCAAGCTNRLSPASSVKFFRIPVSDPQRREKWILAIRRVDKSSKRPDRLWEPKEHDRICCQHFVKGCPSKEPLDVDYVPTLFVYTPKTNKCAVILKQKLARQGRLHNRQHLQHRSAAAQALLSLASGSFKHGKLVIS